MYVIYAFTIIVYTLLNVFGVKLLHSLNLFGEWNQRVQRNYN